ncbi:MAG TPA: hypothetical protein VNN22_15105 [Verrucomicrobiae bacterium]|nr:hypothetical protein [Verrucomicrobiae bacterium]
MTLTYNLKLVLNLVSFQKLMVAAGYQCRRVRPARNKAGCSVLTSVGIPPIPS